MPLRKYRSSGFTLVELLVVIFILALLIAIISPAIKAALCKVKTVLCKSNLRQIGIALESYQTENRGFAPFLDTNPAVYHGEPRDTPEQMLENDLSREWKIWLCPADKIKARAVWHPLLEQNIPPEARNISYTWSEPLIRGFYDGHPSARGNPWKPLPYYTFKGAVLADGNRMLNVWTWQEALRASYEYNCLDQSHCLTTYHRVNLLFADNHIELITCDEETLKTLRPY